jgi:hypothetical protein
MGLLYLYYDKQGEALLNSSLTKDKTGPLHVAPTRGPYTAPQTAV